MVMGEGMPLPAVSQLLKEDNNELQLLKIIDPGSKSINTCEPQNVCRLVFFYSSQKTMYRHNVEIK